MDWENLVAELADRKLKATLNDLVNDKRSQI
jgi:hypothetical protein